MLKGLSDRPDVENLERFLDLLLERCKDDLEFIVLFGSMARGNWTRGSDYDIFIGLRGEDQRRLIDRMSEFTPPNFGRIEVFPYSRSEWKRMFKELHPLLLEACEYGVVLWDRGGFARIRETFRKWRRAGRVTPWRSGWRIAEPGTADR